MLKERDAFGVSLVGKVMGSKCQHRDGTGVCVRVLVSFEAGTQRLEDALSAQLCRGFWLFEHIPRMPHLELCTVSDKRFGAGMPGVGECGFVGVCGCQEREAAGHIDVDTTLGVGAKLGPPRGELAKVVDGLGVLFVVHREQSQMVEDGAAFGWEPPVMGVSLVPAWVGGKAFFDQSVMMGGTSRVSTPERGMSQPNVEECGLSIGGWWGFVLWYVAQQTVELSGL